jgi:hypothetical protein
MDKNFATLDMTREELSEKFNYNINEKLFNYMKKIDYGEKDLLAAAEDGDLEAAEEVHKIEKLQVEDTWLRMIEEEKIKKDHERLLNKTNNDKKSIGTLGKTRHELIDYFEKYISPDLFDIFFDYPEEDERAKIEDQVGKMSDEKWKEERDFILEDAWEKALDENES